MMNNPFRLILLTGPKHSGKSLCSRALGKITGFGVVDLDELVEKQTGKTPRALFNEGHEIFREAEARAFASIISSPSGKDISQKPGAGLVIAAGGGFIDNSEAVALLSLLLDEPQARSLSGLALFNKNNRELITVYLEVSAETAWQRILADGELPPFLILNGGNPMETHLALHKRRAESYKALAHISIFAENKNPDEIAEEIVEHLEKIS